MKNKFPLVMKSMAALTCTATIILAAVCHFFPAQWLFAAAVSLGTTAYHFLMRLAVGYILPGMTRYNFDYRHAWFRPRRWEASFYKKLKIRKWKSSLPTYAPGQFSLAENSLHQVIRNMCGAEIVHEVIMVLSFLPLLAVPVLGAFPVFLITSVLSALFDSVFVMAQRYNRPRLVRIFEKQEANTQ